MPYLTSQGPPSAHSCWLRGNGDTGRISTRRCPPPTTQSSGSLPGLAPDGTAWGLELGMPHLAGPETLSWATGRKQSGPISVVGPGPRLRGGGGGGCSSPSGQGVLRTVHLRISLVSEQTAWSPPGAWSTLRVRSSEPLRKPQSFFLLAHGPHGDHSLISHCAGRKGEEREKGEEGHRMPQGSFSHRLSTWGSGPEGRRVLRETPEGGLG